MNRLYFICASALFFLSAYQVNLSTSVLDKQMKMTGKLVRDSYFAGCVTGKIDKEECKRKSYEYSIPIENLYINDNE